jgi:hypothetical protein
MNGSDDPRWALVERVAKSSAFSRTRQMRRLLLYVCRRALHDGVTTINDAEIAAAVLRDRPFDGHASGLVRGQVSLVRKRLRQHFAAEGRDEAVVIELARGRYVPTFRARAARDDDEGAARSIPAPPSPRLRRWSALAFGAAAALTLIAAGLRASGPSPSAPSSEVARLWRQMFDNGRSTTVVLADANLTLFQDILGRPLALADYRRERMNELMDERVPAREWHRLAGRSLEQRHTAMGDVAVASRALALHAELGLRAEVIFARDVTVRQLTSRNVILSGPRRANPWLELYESRLNFQSRFDEATKIASFENRDPRPGERLHYDVQWSVRGFCRVAYLPGSDIAASLLMVSGTDMTSTEAGAVFISSESGIRALRRRLRLSADQPFPYFEILLDSALVLGTTASTPALVAHRVIS